MSLQLKLDFFQFGHSIKVTTEVYSNIVVMITSH